jgi:hypothetical protein
MSSMKQRLNNPQSSTESELVAVCDCIMMPAMILWTSTRYFLEAQGYGTKDAIVYQVNKKQSGKLKQENGKASCGKHTKTFTLVISPF